MDEIAQINVIHNLLYNTYSAFLGWKETNVTKNFKNSYERCLENWRTVHLLYIAEVVLRSKKGICGYMDSLENNQCGFCKRKSWLKITEVL